jgi:RNA polymerase sigma factor (TIGR02999 family)
MVEAADLTALLQRAQAGDGAAAEAIFEATYGELRELAHARLSGSARHTLLDTTALVHEWFLKFCAARELKLESRGQFMRHAARAMRMIIVEFAREKSTVRRGGNGAREGFALASPTIDHQAPEEILAVHRALEALAELDQRMADVVELRYFGGLSEVETGQALGITERTVRRDWEKARLWLTTALRDAPEAR